MKYLMSVIALGIVVYAGAGFSEMRKNLPIYAYDGFADRAEGISVAYSDDGVEASYGDVVINGKFQSQIGAATIFSLGDLGYFLYLPADFDTSIPFSEYDGEKVWEYGGCQFSFLESKPVKLPGGESSYFYVIDSRCSPESNTIRRFIYSSEYGLISFFTGYYRKNDTNRQGFVAVGGYYLLYPSYGFGNRADRTNFSSHNPD